MARHTRSLFSELQVLLLCAAGCYPSPEPPQQSCGSDDPRVGYIAELTTRMHGVSGTARIVDNCTIVIENFNWDGLGVRPAVVGVTRNDFENPVILRDDIFRLGGYHNETLPVPLPEGVTLDDVPMISIDCLGGSAVFGYGNFGEGIFHAPGTPQPDPLTYWN